MTKDTAIAIMLIPVIFIACVYCTELANFVGCFLYKLFSFLG